MEKMIRVKMNYEGDEIVPMRDKRRWVRKGKGRWGWERKGEGGNKKEEWWFEEKKES